MRIQCHAQAEHCQGLTMDFLANYVRSGSKILKPYGTTEQAAEKSGWRRFAASGAKALSDFARLTRR